MQTTTYKLNVTPGGVPLTIHISQYDVGLRQYTFEPYTNVGEFSYVSGATVTLEATKPDGYAVIHSCVYNQDGTITYTIQEQLAAKPGRVWSKVVIRDGADVLGTGAVLWIVDYAGVKDGAIISDSDISGLEGYVDQLKTLVGTPIAVTTAAGMTDHGKLYLYEGSESGYTAGDWYYWDGSAWTSGGEYGSGAVEIDPTLSIAGEAADAKATGDGLDELKNDIGVLDSDIILNKTTTNTGTGASFWGVNITDRLSSIDDDYYFVLLSASGVSVSANPYLTVHMSYTTGSNVPTDIREIGKLYKLNIDKTRTYVQTNILFYRADSAVGSAVTSSYAYAIFKGTPNALEIDNLIYQFRLGAEIAYHRHYENTGSGFSIWETSIPLTINDDSYLKVLETENVSVSAGTRFMWFRVMYTDNTSTDTSIYEVGKWYKINYDKTKTVSYVNIAYQRSDSALDHNVKSVWDYIITKNKPFDVLYADANKATRLNSPVLANASPKFIMHRGYSSNAPENTIPAFTLAGQANAWGIEGDVYELTDGEFVCFHDSDVARMTDGTGDIKQMSYAQVSALTIDAGANIDQYPNLKIPKLIDYLKVCRRYGSIAFIDIKWVGNYSNFVSTIRNYGMLNSCVFAVSDESSIQNIRSYTDAPITILCYPAGNVDNIISMAKKYYDCWVDVDSSLTNATAINSAHSYDLPFGVWVIDSTDAAETMFANGVDMITSDSIAHF